MVTLGAPVTNNFTTTTAYTYTFNVGPGQFIFNGSPIARDVVLFAANPIYPNSYAQTDRNGGLFFATPFGDEGTFTFAPFFEGFIVGSAAENKNRVVEIAWSPNGLYLAYLIDPPPGTDNVNAGVWFWQPGGDLPTDPTYALLRDCPYDGHRACEIVSGRPASHWRSLKMEWSPDSRQLLVTLDLPDEGRRGIAVVDAVRSAEYANTAPTIWRYDSGYWTADGRIVVSGRRPSDGRVIIGIINRDGSGEQVLLDGTSLGLWLQDAVITSNGRVYAFGNPGGPGAPVSLYDGNGTALTGPIGDSAPIKIEWFSGRNGATLMTASGRQFQVLVNGTVRELFPSGNITLSSGPVGAPPVPDGVVVGAAFAPGQQVTFSGDTARNLRAEPTLNGAIIGFVGPGEYVAILAGPYDSDGFRWWRVLNARNQIGWLADIASGGSLLQP